MTTTTTSTGRTALLASAGLVVGAGATVAALMLGLGGNTTPATAPILPVAAASAHHATPAGHAIAPLAPPGRVAPLAPVTHVTPLAPITPVTPLTPVTPVSPLAPVTPVPPLAPVTPVTPPIPVTPAAPSAAIETLQNELGQLNYYEGPVTGTMTPQTVQAITDLQRDAHLPRTGAMDAATQAALANFLANGNNQMGA